MSEFETPGDTRGGRSWVPQITPDGLARLRASRENRWTDPKFLLSAAMVATSCIAVVVIVQMQVKTLVDVTDEMKALINSMREQNAIILRKQDKHEVEQETLRRDLNALRDDLKTEQVWRETMNGKLIAIEARMPR